MLAISENGQSIENGPSSSVTDVVVVGAGPCGLMAAQALSRLGVDVKVIERRALGAQYGNADGIQPRTLEIWQSYGILNDFRTKAAAMIGMVAYESKEDGSGITRGVPSRNVIVHTRYPYELTASIETIEATLRESLERNGGQVIQPACPLSIEFNSQNEVNVTYPVKVTIQHLSAEAMPISSDTPSEEKNGMTYTAPASEEIHAKYVIGADGAHSWVRRELGINLKGDLTEYVWGVTDVNIDTDFPDHRFKAVIQSSGGAIIFIPREGDKVRIYVQLSPHDSVKKADGRLDKSKWCPESIRAKVLNRIVDGLKPYRIKFNHVFWCTIFSVPQMVAATYAVKQRIFIAGDACHIHSPKAGQGANASMGDSHNLAWKLAHVLRGWAKESLLDTYEIERRKYAQDLIAFDQRIAKTLDDGAASDYSGMLHEQNMFTSGVGIHYVSPLTDQSGDFLTAHVKAGERLPPADILCLGDWQSLNVQDLAPSDGLFKLLVFAGDILQLEQSSRLSEFSRSFEATLNCLTRDRISVHTILDNRKETVHWRLVPDVLQSWRRVFVDDIEDTDSSASMKGSYGRYGLAPQGAVMLVRPDGYISVVVELSDTGARRALAFLENI